jgi:hypothetical protein
LSEGRSALAERFTSCVTIALHCEGTLVHEVIQVGERLAEGEAHLVPLDGCWRPATWGRCRVSIQKWTSGSNPLSSSGESGANSISSIMVGADELGSPKTMCGFSA